MQMKGTIVSITGKLLSGLGVVAVLCAVGFGIQIAKTDEVGIPFIFTAQSSAADQDFSTIEQSQQVSLATDELYAPSLASLRDGTFTFVIPTTTGRDLSYIASTDRKHYVVAERLPSGMVRVASNTTTQPITCTHYTPKCLANVTADAALIAATPNWVTF